MNKKFEKFDKIPNHNDESDVKTYIWSLPVVLDNIKFIGTIDERLAKTIENHEIAVKKTLGIDEIPFKLKYGTNSKKCNRIVGRLESNRKGILDLAEEISKNPKYLVDLASPILISGFTDNDIDGQNRSISAYLGALRLILRKETLDAANEVWVPVTINCSESLGRTTKSSAGAKVPDWNYCNSREEIVMGDVNKARGWSIEDVMNRNRNSNNDLVRKAQEEYDYIKRSCVGVPTSVIHKIFYPRNINTVIKNSPEDLKCVVSKSEVPRYIKSLKRAIEFQIAMTHLTAITSFGKSNQPGRWAGFVEADIEANLSDKEWKKLIEKMNSGSNPEWFDFWEEKKVVCGKTLIIDNNVINRKTNYNFFMSIFERYK